MQAVGIYLGTLRPAPLALDMRLLTQHGVNDSTLVSLGIDSVVCFVFLGPGLILDHTGVCTYLDAFSCR